MGGRWSLMASCVNVGGVLVKVEVIVKVMSFKAVNDLHRLMVDGYGVLGWRATYYEFFGLW